MPNRRTFIALAAAASACLAVPAAPALASGGLVDVELVDRGRHEALQVWRFRGDDWVAGRPGGRYAVRLSNRCGARVLVVLSVDGVNAISGETAATAQIGYVLDPYQTTEITGWRKSMTEAAAFYFAALSDSYAARTARPDNVGVIGVAVFRERAREAAWPLTRRGDRGAEDAADRLRESEPPTQAAPSAAAKAAQGTAGVARDERLGTGHGEREYAPTTQTSFDRAGEQPNEVVRIRYDSYDRLVALGVIRPQRVPPRPEPFPAFVPDPKG